MSKSSSSLSFALSVLFCCAYSAACDSGSASSRAEEAPQVTVLVYSGRPNPVFALTPAQVARVAEIVHGAQPDLEFRGESVLPSILGYTGLVIRNPRRAGGLPEALAVYGGRLELSEGGARRVVADGGALETYLLDLAVAEQTVSAELRLRVEESRQRRD